MDLDHFGFRVRQLREGKSFTMQELCDRAGIRTQELWRIEHGERTPRLEIAAKLAASLGVSVDFLINGKTLQRSKA